MKFAAFALESIAKVRAYAQNYCSAKLVTLAMSVHDRLSTANPFWDIFCVVCK